MKNTEEDNRTTQLDQEINSIDALLRNKDFALEVAKRLDATYHVGVGEAPPPFSLPKDDTASVQIKAKDEKVAVNLAGFYALECGLGALCEQTGQKPIDLLQTIVSNKADSRMVLLLNRFANATWKAGQPFRSLDRIKRPVFRVASLLSADEVKKDYAQIETAATKLLTSMQNVRASELEDQMAKLQSLLKDKYFAVEMAVALAAKHYFKRPELPFLTPEEETAVIIKSAEEQKIATNMAGFYALECGLNYLVTTQQKLPSSILKSITDNTISTEDKQLLCRFANATWKAGQPFLGIGRITHNTFAPFYFLSKADVEKDWAQVKAATGLALQKL